MRTGVNVDKGFDKDGKELRTSIKKGFFPYLLVGEEDKINCPPCESKYPCSQKFLGIHHGSESLKPIQTSTVPFS